MFIRESTRLIHYRVRANLFDTRLTFTLKRILGNDPELQMFVFLPGYNLISDGTTVLFAQQATWL